MESQLEILQIPEIWETGKEKLFSIKQLKNKYLLFAREKYQGNVYINKDTQNLIRVSRDGINEWWKKSRKREHIIAVQLLDFFLESGKFMQESPDYFGRKKIISASQFESICKINGKLYKVILTTRKAVYDMDKFRYFSLKKP
jgi:hypothetical protein